MNQTKLSLFYQSVTNIDIAYLDKEGMMQPLSLLLDVELQGNTLKDTGMIYDFSQVKKIIKKTVDTEFDHRLILPSSPKVLKNFQDFSHSFQLSLPLSSFPFSYKAVKEAICFLPAEEVTSSSMSHHLENLIISKLPQRVERVKIGLREMERKNNYHYFSYTHSLKNHQGNCQRLFHGHTSSVSISLKNKREKSLEEEFVHEFCSFPTHFTHFDDVLNKDEVLDIFQGDREKPFGKFPQLKTIKISYESTQGHYYAEVPGANCYLMPLIPTIENMVFHFHERVSKKLKTQEGLSLTLFEGIGKGANFSS